MAEAKKYKANQQEYDALAQIISKHPDRDSSEKQIQQIDSEIQSLNKENDALNEKLLGRRRELHVLLQVWNLNFKTFRKDTMLLF